MKRVLAVVLSLAMLLGLMPTAMASDERELSETIVEATELSGVSRLDAAEQSSGRQPAAKPLYADDDIVTVIVQLEGPSLLDYYHPGYLASDEVTAGEAVSQFLDEPEVREASEELLAQQESVLARIGGLQAAEVRAYSARTSGVKVVAQWTALINGMAIQIPYGMLSAIQSLDGVKRAYVEHTYDAPEPEFGGAGNAGFSYDMVNLTGAWSAGYTGKGMLVAIVDTGLDLEYASFWDDASGDNVTDIRRTHEAFREDSFQSALSDSDLRYTKASIQAVLQKHTLRAHVLTSPSAVDEAAYKNKKVPYAFDYAGDADEYGTIISGDVNVFPGLTGNNHGTHVAGTVAGYSKTEEGEVKFSGVAPDAQLMIMKVFADQGGGATDTAIMNALEDSLILGADVVNLSLGSDNGYANDDTPQAEVYRKLEDAGIILMTAAGNSAYSSTMNARDDHYDLASNPEISMMSAPAVYASNLSVASINNTVNTQMTLVWNDGTADHKAAFTDPYDVAMKSTFSPANMPEGGYEIIPVGGTGTSQDYYDAGFRRSGYEGGKTGIALVQRGEISFADKVSNAQSFVWQDYQQGQVVRGGVMGVIIYDNVEGELLNMNVGEASITSAAISKASGDAMVAAVEEGKTVTLQYVNQEDEFISYSGGYEMSSFSSWGAGPGLELKPEITAPGGNIWSTVFDTSYREGAGYYNDYDGAYAMMSGTSMATPHMSGLAALVRQYVQKTGKAAGADAADLTNHLLVSTAVPQKQPDKNAYYSPRLQGAGLVNVGAAVKTPAYISVQGQLVGKLELKDDPNWTGQYELSFQVNNLTASPVTYTVQAAVQRPDITTIDGRTFMTDSDVLIKTVDLGTVTVPANGSVTVNKSIALTADEIQTVRRLFPNGAYIEGFVLLSSSDAEVPPIGLPYLAFLGDWTAAPIFDSTLWIDGDNPWENGDYTWFPTVIGSAIIAGYEVLGWLNLGQNIFDPTAENTQTSYKKGNLTISPNGDGYLDTIDDIELYQLRDAKIIVVEVRDANTNELYYRDFSSYNTKTLYDANYGVAIPSSLYYFTGENWSGTDLNGDRLPSGTQCIYTITAYGDGEYQETAIEGYDYPITDFWAVDPNDPSTEPTFNGHAMDKTGDVISFPVVVDYVAPKLQNSAVSVYEENGRTYIEGTAYDEDGSLASVEIHPVVVRTYASSYGDPNYSETGLDYINPFYSQAIYDEAKKTLTFKADVTEYAHTIESYPGENNTYNYTWTGYVAISCGDYGANDRTYSVKVADMAQPGEILLSQNSALLHPGSTFELSVVDNSDSDAAITRTSSDPSVAVVDEFGNVTAIAPGQATITVSNGVSSAVCVVAVEEYPTEVIDFDLSIDHFEGLKAGAPITVNVTDLQPADVAIENISWMVYEDNEDWAGLVEVYRNTQDAMSGQIELIANVSEDLIPGGSGYLEVTINGVSRRMTFTWEDVPTSTLQDDLMSAANYGEQTVYIPYGETATLIAKYKQNHDFVPVKLYTAVGAADYQLNSTDPAEGLILDAQPFANTGGQWSGRIVNEEGYALPDSIQLFTRYNDYEVEITNTWTTNYTYDSTTGEIWVAYAPYGSSSTMVIRADGVASEGTSAGELSGNDYEMPDSTYGPFNWDFTAGLDSVSGDLELAEESDFYGNIMNVARFTPSEPGVSYLTASSKDGQYSVNFAVVCEPIVASSLTLNVRDLDLEVGGTSQLVPTLSPEPTLDKNQEIIWTSFNPDVVQVDEDGQVTGLRSGYAYIKAAVRTDTTVQGYCVVKVGSGLETSSYPISYVLNGGSWLSSSIVPQSYTFSDEEQVIDVSAPIRNGYTFTGWTYSGQNTPTQYVRLPAGFTGDLELHANWELEYVPNPIIPAPQPSTPKPTTPTTPDTTEPDEPAEPSQPEEPAIRVNTSGAEDDTVTTAVPDSVVTEDTAVSVVTEEMAEEIIRQVVNRESNLVVIAPEMPEDVTKAEVSIPADAVGELAVKTEADLQVVTPVATVTIPNQALSGLAADSGHVTVTMERSGSTVEVSVAVNGQKVDRLNGGMTVTIPQTNCGPGTVAMLVREDGSMTVVRQSLASSDGRSITVPLDGSAKLVILDNSQSFTDVPASSWAAGAVAFASSHELMNGTGEGIFDPNESMTRGMFAVVLHNLEGNPSGTAGSSFTDVSGSAWYAEAVSWAVGEGIVAGYGNGSFGPSDPITREQMAVLLYRYAGSPAVSASTSSFADEGDISSYAGEAVKWAVSVGVMNGKGNGILDPKGTATRAEVAQMLLNFLSNAVK